MSSSADLAARMNAAEMRLAAQRRDTKMMVWGIVAFGALLRLHALGAKSFWLDEIASVVDFLLGPEAAYVHGSVVFVDGGIDANFRPGRF